MVNKKICILSFSPIAIDSRVLREIKAAGDHFEITVIGYGKWQPPDYVNYIELKRNKRNFLFLLRYGFFLLLGLFHRSFYEHAYWIKKEYWSALRFISEGKFDIIHANDWDSLPVAAKAKKNNSLKILFDAHEYSPEQEANTLFGKVFIKPYRGYFFNQYLKKADKVITVSAGIQDLYSKHFGIKSELILNASEYKQFHYSPTDENRISIIHHGNAVKNRYIEEMISMISLTDERFTLYLMLVERSDKKYMPYLKRFAQKRAPGRVVFIPSVDETKVLDAISSFDIGLPFLKASQKNILNALPNKFFQYIMAGLAIIIPPLPAMAEIIKREMIGCVARSIDARAVANMLNKLDRKKIDIYKRHSLELAKRMNAEVEMDKLLTMYQELLVDKSK
jgi:glycosyltransferase involved in cell wall biosynthesis